ncbi:hypothetical protein LJB42_001603 [Komagataella kurtzmanii]|nr:hypothetical protein LJB42_001603 [Komagataella kurtzmanii]
MLPLLVLSLLLVLGSFSHPTKTSQGGNLHVNNILKNSKRLSGYPPLFPEHKRIIQDGQVPYYVVEYAPLVHLYSEEKYFPCDIARYVDHFHAVFGNGSDVPGGQHLNIGALSKLNHYSAAKKGSEVFLMANTDFDKNPDYITGRHNKPKYINGEIEEAPAVLIVVDKGNGWVDAFWFYFYGFNLGPFVMGTGPFGNHVGDWEHSLVRFYNGSPIIVWMSAHGGGGSYFYKNLEKHYNDDKRPVIFSARGTHANYASVGQQNHDLPWAMLSDFTDRGPLWDPTKNFLAYTYSDGRITYANGSHPKREERYGDWLYFEGRWGDNKLPSSDERQKWSPFEWKYIAGPSGPLSKNLDRLSPCQRTKWWNFWDGCNTRVYPKMGQGIESEGNNGCGNIFRGIRSGIVRSFVQTITWGGWACWVLDLIYG